MQIEVAKKQLIKYGEELCGDTAEVLRTQDRTVVVLADGLGSGVKANILWPIPPFRCSRCIMMATPIFWSLTTPKWCWCAGESW